MEAYRFVSVSPIKKKFHRSLVKFVIFPILQKMLLKKHVRSKIQMPMYTNLIWSSLILFMSLHVLLDQPFSTRILWNARVPSEVAGGFLSCGSHLTVLVPGPVPNKHQ